MLETFVIHQDFKKEEKQIYNSIKNFKENKNILGDGSRNCIKIDSIQQKDRKINITIKNFKKPNFINKIAYRYFRMSKAQRSYEYANKLLELNISTPKPIGYYLEQNTTGLYKSAYISELQECDYTYRDLTLNHNIEDFENILRAFTRFTFDMHQKGVKFLDHSPGNTLIRKSKNNQYKFYLVDLNRMEFKKLNLKERIDNFAKLTIHSFMVKIMSDEYAKCCNEDPEKLYNMMWKATEDFQEKFYRKKRWKKCLKFK